MLAAACGGGEQTAIRERDTPPDSGPGTSGTPPSTATTTTATTAPATTTAGGQARFVTSGPGDGGRVALTFHTDGDLALAQQLTDVLTARQVPVTAFVVGEWLDANPDWARRLTDGGHELANHTYTHPSFEELDPAAMADEVSRCRDVIARLTGGDGGTCFRPSGTADGTAMPSAATLEVAAQAGYRVVLGFGVDPLDYQDPGADAVVERTLAAAAPGAVVSLHFGHPGTITALPAILDGLAARELRPVTASELLGLA